MSFIVYDLAFLVVFVLLVSLFLYRGKKNLGKEGLMLLYRAQWGVKLINYIGGKYKKTLSVLSYVSITLGYLLMAGMVYLFGKIIWIYVFQPAVVRAVKIPPIMPLIPYLPQAFKLDFLPPFYFTYWILIIAIIAITHEFAHGIFMKRYNVNIKSTGFGFFPFFFPVFLAAFVEQEEKSFSKASKFKQMAILSAGTFANVLTALFFFVVTLMFFSVAFSPAGVTFDTYAYNIIEVGSITMINNISLENPNYERLEIFAQDGLNKIKTADQDYVISKSMLEKQKKTQEELITVYYDSPAVNANLSGVIQGINGKEITSKEEFAEEFYKYSPGEEITLNIFNGEDNFNQDIILKENPVDNSKPWLGFQFLQRNSSNGIVGSVLNWFTSFKEPNIYYEPVYGEWSEFIYNLLWWIILISLSVALVNMLPVGIFDGGRFFHLTIWGLTKNRKIADKVFVAVTWLFLFAVFLLMFFWVKSFI